MATVNYEKIFTEVRGVQVIAWKGLKNGDTGQPYECAPWSDKSVQVSGTFGTGGNCRIEGSLMVSNPAWATLNDAQGNALDITIAKIETILEHTYQIRPNITAGDASTNLDVYLIMYSKQFGS